MKRDLGSLNSSPIGIRPKRSPLVKWLGLASAVPALLPIIRPVITTLGVVSVSVATSWADEPTPMATSDTNPEEDLPSIEAITFPVTIERRSTSGHVYLLSTTGEIPQTGRLILLKKENAPIMAFRVLREYGSKKQFAAKWMRRYNDTKQLEPDQSYTAFEKLTDRTPEPLTNQDRKDLSEIEKPAEPTPAPTVAEVPPPEASPEPQALAAPTPAASSEANPAIADEALPPPPGPAASTAPQADIPPPLPTETPVAQAEPPPPADDGIPKPAPVVPNPEGYDSELDSGTSPPPKAVAETIAEAKDPEADDLSSVMVEEKRLPVHDLNFLGAGAGIYQNKNPSGTMFFTPGGYIQYSHILGQQIFQKGGKGAADDFAFDASLGYYKILTLVNSGDSYTVVPVSGDLRYTIMFTDDFGMFVYGGLEQNVVAATTNPTPQAQTNLNSLIPAVGIGALFRAGPSWYVRLDGGYQGAGLSLAIRF